MSEPAPANSRLSKAIGLALIALACVVAFGPAVGISLPSLPSIVAPAEASHALAVEESTDRIKLTPSQVSLLDGTGPESFAAYAKQAFGPNNFFVLDQDQDVERMPEWVKGVWAYKTDIPPPRFYVVRGSRIDVYPLPKDTAEAIELVK